MLALVLGVCLADRLLPQRFSNRRQDSAKIGGVLFGVLLLLGLLGVAMSPSLVWVFSSTALVFAGVGGLTPKLLAWLADQRADQSLTTAAHPLARWRYRELAVMVRRLALPVVALQFAVAAVLAIQALVTSFEATFEQWLAQRLSADWYVELPTGAKGAAAETIFTRFEAESRAAEQPFTWHRVARGRVRVSTLAGEPLGTRVDLLALSARDSQAPVSDLVSDWSLLEAQGQPWERVAEGQIMVNEQLALRHGLALGDQLQMVFAETEPEQANQSGTFQARVVGVYADYGRPSGEILISASWLPEGFVPRFESFSVNASQGSIEVLTRELKQLWQVDELEVRNNGMLKALASSVFQQTFLLTRAISVLTLALAAVSLLIMGWVFFNTRLWYYQLLDAWGVSLAERRGELLRLSLGLSLSVALAALPLGIWLTWVLVSRINPLAFGWSLPMAVYPVFWLELLALSAGIGWVIAWLMGREQARRLAEPPGASQIAGGER